MPIEQLPGDAESWRARRTWRARDVDVRDLVARKAGRTVSVVIPALNEGATVGGVVSAVVDTLTGPGGLVDEVVVIDPGSTDDTAARAGAAGARVVVERDVLAAYGTVPGKGEALWKSLHATTGDLLVFLDGDVRDPTPAFTVGLLAPLLLEPEVSFVKAVYDRPLSVDGVLRGGGGRVTELVARPLINRHWPALAGFVQPLSGELGARRTLLERLPFAGGYGVEIAMLVDVLATVGLDGMAQVDLERRVHRNSSDEALGRMAAAIWDTVQERLHREGRLRLSGPVRRELTQFHRADDGAYEAVTTGIAVSERPPMVTVPEYLAHRADGSAGRLSARPAG